MATCDNCGHNQSDFLSSDDIEAIQFRSITLDQRCATLESENASLKAMLKTQSDHHQTRVQELLNGFEDGIRGIKHNNGSEVEELRRENEILKSSVFELNLKLKSSDDLVKALKAQRYASLEEIESSKEALKESDDFLKELKGQLVKAFEDADTAQEFSSLRDDEKHESLTVKDDTLDKQLEESFGNSLERIKNAFNSTHVVGATSPAAETTPSSSQASTPLQDRTKTFSDGSSSQIGPQSSLTNTMMKEEKEEASTKTAMDESDIEVVEMTDEMINLVF